MWPVHAKSTRAAAFVAVFRRFAAAEATLNEYCLVGERAECLHEWGRALARAGDRAGAAGKHAAARELYLLHGAGRPWLQRLDAERERV